MLSLWPWLHQPWQICCAIIWVYCIMLTDLRAGHQAVILRFLLFTDSLCPLLVPTELWHPLTWISIIFLKEPGDMKAMYLYKLF